MEANKDEAVKATEIAEKNIKLHDFVAAKKFVLKAQQLFPALEGVTQMLVVLDVHIIARNKIMGNKIDWYGILQVDKTADDKLIKKQYHKLALLLHPHKNKSLGAEEAFKLVGEANCVLSDRTKRTIHDRKTNATTRPTDYASSSHQRNEFWREKQRHTTCYQTTPGWTTSFAGQHFWTACPTCDTQHQILYTHLGLRFMCHLCGYCFLPTRYNKRKCTCYGPEGNPSNPFVPPEEKTRQQKDEGQSSTYQNDTSTRSTENTDPKKRSSKPFVPPQHKAPQQRDEGQSSTQENDATTSTKENRNPKRSRSKPFVPPQHKAPQQRDESQSSTQENDVTTSTKENRNPKTSRSKPFVPPQHEAPRQKDEGQSSTQENDATTSTKENRNPKRSRSKPFVPPRQKDEGQSSTQENSATTSTTKNRVPKRSRSKPCVPPQPKASQQRDEDQSSTNETGASTSTTENRVPKSRSKSFIPPQHKAPQQRDEGQPSTQENNATWEIHVVEAHGFKTATPTTHDSNQLRDAYNQYCEVINRLHEATMKKVHEERKSKEAFTQFKSNQPTTIDATNVSAHEDPHATGGEKTSVPVTAAAVSNPVEKSLLKKCQEDDVEEELKRNGEEDGGVVKQQQKEATKKLIKEAKVRSQW